MENEQLIGHLKKLISHDLASPLTNTKSYLDLLKSANLSPEEKEAILARIEENNLKALELIANMRITLKSWNL